MRRLAKRAVDIILGLLLVVVVFAFLLSVVFSGRLAIVRSGSMEPSISVGALAVITPIDPEEVKVGDIIVFNPPRDPRIMNPDVTVSHRVIEVQANGELQFITKGDAVEDPDIIPIPAENVQGKLIFAIPYLGYTASSIIRYVRTWLGLVLLVFIPLAVLIGGTIRDVNMSRSVRVKRLERRLERQRRWKRRSIFGLT
jgi:signal peptidase